LNEHKNIVFVEGLLDY